MHLWVAGGHAAITQISPDLPTDNDLTPHNSACTMGNVKKWTGDLGELPDFGQRAKLHTALMQQPPTNSSARKSKARFHAKVKPSEVLKPEK